MTLTKIHFEGLADMVANAILDEVTNSNGVLEANGIIRFAEIELKTFCRSQNDRFDDRKFFERITEKIRKTYPNWDAFDLRAAGSISNRGKN